MIAFNTDKPAELLKAFDDAIARGHKNGITTWQKIGSHYTHAAAQWHKKAYVKPEVISGRLVFNIIKNQASDVTVTVYGFYHGHLVETFLNHFDRLFAGVTCTPLCSGSDYCSAAA